MSLGRVIPNLRLCSNLDAWLSRDPGSGVARDRGVSPFLSALLVTRGCARRASVVVLRYPRQMVRPYNERAAWEQGRAELVEQIAAVQRDLDATPIDNMPRRGRLTWTIRRGGEAAGRDRRSARARPPMTARLALIGAALLLATSCNFNESRWVLRAWAPPARCSLAVRITSRISCPACPAYRRLHEVVILLSSGRV